MREQYYMIFNNVTGEIKGYYIAGIWEYENILKEVGENEFLKEIGKDVWDSLIGNNENIKINSPKLKSELIEQFNNVNLLNEDLTDYMNMYFEETYYEPIPHEPTQQEKDIKFLAEMNKNFIEAMSLETEGQANPALEKVQEIIDRYS